jgi:hypothetical protein
MAVEVALFNTSSQTILFVINNGPQCAVAGTGTPGGWQPQTQAPRIGPTYSPGYPQPNMVGNLGLNQITAYVSGGPIGGAHFSFSLPTSHPVSSVQIYLFIQPFQSVTWVVLTDGRVCAQQIANPWSGSSPEGEAETK